MKRFLDLLRQPKPSSADLRAAADANDVAAAEADLARLQKQRAALLMEGDDKTLDALEAQIRAAARQVERAVTVRDQLAAAVQEAEAREAYEALTAERARVEAEAVAVKDALLTLYPRLAADLVALLERLAAAEKAVKATNSRLHEAGRGDDVLAPVETRAFPLGPHQYGPERSILNRTNLIELKGLSPGW